MQILLDCLPCMLRQVLEASRLVTDRLDLQEKVMKDSIQILSDYQVYGSSPALCRAMHQVVKKYTCIEDPYARIKRRDLEAAKQMLPYMAAFLRKKRNSLSWALKLSATGNMIDSAVDQNADMMKYIDKELEKDFSLCDLAVLQEKLESARKILIIGDNAGETVFDRVLAERLAPAEIAYAVRSEPVLNDATEEDAYASGLADCAEIISTGCSAPGVILEDCGKDFLDLFKRADIVISKGQGNFEALSDCGRPVFFLLKAKCPAIAQKLGVHVNDYVLKYRS